MADTHEHTVSLDIPSTTQFLHILRAAVEEIVHYMKLDEEVKDQVLLVVVEAGANAIKHGNQGDATKRVRFEFAIQANQLTVVVEDEGQGFKRDQVPDPLEDENLLKLGGRGLLLIETFMDRVTYEKSGRTVRMVKAF